MLSPELIDSSPEISKVSSPFPPIDQSQLAAQTNATPTTTQHDLYDPSNPLGVVHQDFNKMTKILDVNFEEQKKMKDILDGLSEEIRKDNEVLTEKSLTAKEERDKLNRKIHVHVVARDQERARLIMELSKPATGHFDYGDTKITDFSKYNSLQAERQILQDRGAGIFEMENDVANMKKKVDEKEVREQNLKKHQYEIIEEYHRMTKEMIAVLHKIPPIQDKAPVVATDRRPTSALSYGSGPGLKRVRWDVSVSSPTDSKKKKFQTTNTTANLL